MTRTLRAVGASLFGLGTLRRVISEPGSSSSARFSSSMLSNSITTLGLIFRFLNCWSISRRVGTDASKATSRSFSSSVMSTVSLLASG